MKKYRLRQWYPSLYDDLEVGTIVDYEDGWIYYTNKRGNKTTIEIDEWELSHKDFWKLIEEGKPLFTTDDGVEVYDINFLVFAVKGDFLKIQIFALEFSQNKNDMKSFYHESNADEYIWKNKPLFSYEDFIRWGNVPYERVIMQLAMERSKL